MQILPTTIVTDLRSQPAGDGQSWYALHTKSNFERRVSAELASKGIYSYLPAYEEIHQWKDRKKQVLVPLFPGYVFGRFEWDAEIRVSVLRTPGVVRILGQGADPEPVPEVEVDAIRLLLDSRVPCFAHPFLREGRRVRVKRGVLKGAVGILERFKSSTRLVMSVDLLCRSVAAEVDAADVEPVELSSYRCN